MLELDNADIFVQESVPKMSKKEKKAAKKEEKQAAENERNGKPGKIPKGAHGKKGSDEAKVDEKKEDDVTRVSVEGVKTN